MQKEHDQDIKPNLRVIRDINSTNKNNNKNYQEVQLMQR